MTYEQLCVKFQDFRVKWLPSDILLTKHYLNAKTVALLDGSKLADYNFPPLTAYMTYKEMGVFMDGYASALEGKLSTNKKVYARARNH